MEVKIDMSDDFPEGELFNIDESIFGITKKNWICGTDKYHRIQLIALFELIDRIGYDIMEEGDDERYPIAIHTSLMVHPKFFHKDFIKMIAENDIIEGDSEKYPLYFALSDAYAYGGGININPESVSGQFTCDSEFELVKSKNGQSYKNFKNFDDAEKYIREVYVKNMEAIMALIGFYLDCPWNGIGSTGWDVIYSMTEGKDTFEPAMERYRENSVIMKVLE